MCSFFFWLGYIETWMEVEKGLYVAVKSLSTDLLY